MPTSEKPKVVGSYVVTGQRGPSWGPTRRIFKLGTLNLTKPV